MSNPTQDALTASARDSGARDLEIARVIDPDAFGERDRYVAWRKKRFEDTDEEALFEAKHQLFQGACERALERARAIRALLAETPPEQDGGARVQLRETSGAVQHTPGPWRVAPLTPSRVDTSDGSISISWTDNTDERRAEKLAEANARLIAAAPDMLAGLKAQHRAIDHIMVRLIELDPKFRPTESPFWPDIVAGHAAIRLATTEAR